MQSSGWSWYSGLVEKANALQAGLVKVSMSAPFRCGEMDPPPTMRPCPEIKTCRN